MPLMRFLYGVAVFLVFLYFVSFVGTLHFVFCFVLVSEIAFLCFVVVLDVRDFFSLVVVFYVSWCVLLRFCFVHFCFSCCVFLL